MDRNKNKGFFSTLMSDGLKAAWHNLPIPLKLKIIGGLGLVFFIFILIMIIFNSSPFQFLSFSFDINKKDSEEVDYKEEFKEYWHELCKEEDDCSEEQKKRAEKIEKSQKKFYDKFKSKTKDLNEKQKAIILTTLFFNTNIDDFTESDGAYAIDDDNDSNTNDNNGNDNGETQDNQENSQDLKDIYDDAKDTISTLVKHISTEEEFYSFLLDTDFLDKRETVRSYYTDYASSYGLSTDLKDWDENDLKNVRSEIIYNIKSIVSGYSSDYDSFISIGDETSRSTKYWWPIGSVETTEVNGILYATGKPESTRITSKFGPRNTGIAGASTFHQGVDIGGVREGGTNVIASISGTVIKIVNSCANGTRTCGAMGNYIMVQDINGNINIYEHLYQNSMTVSENDTINQGQVIAKTGNTGVSNGAHLHFTIKVNGTAVDPLGYIDPDNPRPVVQSSGLVDFHKTALTKEEFIAKLTKYYSNATSNKRGFVPFKNEILNNNGAEVIYNAGLKYNINPELLPARSHLEGYSPGTNHNYFGWSCNNEHPENCSNFATFSEAADRFFKGGSHSSSLEEWMFKYAYINDYWLNPGNSGDGGCYYYDSIKEFLSPERSKVVKEACAEDKPCSGSACIPTTSEDQDAYRKYQVKNMKIMIDVMFR